jgi:hypothetical protein
MCSNVARLVRRQKSPLLAGFRSELHVNASKVRANGQTARKSWICAKARRPEAEHQFQQQRGEAS